MLACGYLSIMAASISSEQAFSQRGITITKCHSCLKGDVVEALQCIKCTIRHDLLFHESRPSSTAEAEGDVCDIDIELGEQHEDVDADKEGWERLFLDKMMTSNMMSLILK